jgi:hypothetical protein
LPSRIRSLSCVLALIAATVAGVATRAQATSTVQVVWPFATKSTAQFERVDQGWDLRASSGAGVRAIAAGVVGLAAPNPGGFGNDYPYEVLDDPISGAPSDTIYYGHTHIDRSLIGRHVAAGQVIATTNTTDPQNGSAASPGSLEIGFSTHATGYPVAHGEGPSAAGAFMKLLLINAPVTPPVVVTPPKADTIAAALNRAGRVELFGIGAHGTPYHRWQLAAGLGWTNWTPMNGVVTSLAAVTMSDGREELFVVGQHGTPYRRYQLSQGGWSDWVALNGVVSSLAVVVNADGRLELFAVGQHNVPYHRWQLTASGGWSDWTAFDGAATNLSAARNSDGRLELFAVGTNGAPYHRWQVTAGGAWSDWSQLNGVVSDVAAIANADGRLELFAVGQHNTPYHRWQISGAGGWSDWAAFDGAVSTLAAARNQDGHLEVFGVGGAGTPYHRWRISGTGEWSDWNAFNGVLEN